MAMPRIELLVRSRRISSKPLPSGRRMSLISRSNPLRRQTEGAFHRSRDADVVVVQCEQLRQRVGAVLMVLDEEDTLRSRAAEARDGPATLGGRSHSSRWAAIGICTTNVLPRPFRRSGRSMSRHARSRRHDRSRDRGPGRSRTGAVTCRSSSTALVDRAHQRFVHAGAGVADGHLDEPVGRRRRGDRHACRRRS